MSDALDRLKRKNRPKVQPRSTRVSQRSEDIQTSGHIDAHSLRDEKALYSDVVANMSEDIQTSGHIDAQMSNTSLEPSEKLEELRVKRSTFRLEADLINRLHRLCQNRGISREVMIESMFEYMEQSPDALEQVVREAEVKNAHRQRIANQKRAKAMMEKFG